MMRRLLPIVFLLLIALSGAWALDGIVTWIWYENDPNVSYYRYQLDGEDDDNWTVVEWNVNEVTLELDVSVEHVLYLQQSYDGEVWSVSSFTPSEVYEAGQDVSEEVYFEENAVLEESENPADASSEETGPKLDDVQDVELSEEEAIVNQVAEVKKYDRLIWLDFGVGYLNTIPNSDGPKMLGGFASYNRTFLKASVFDIGAKANLGLYTSKDLILNISNAQMYSYLNVLALATTRIGNCDLYGAIGPEIGLTFINNTSFKAGLAVELGIQYRRLENLFFGFVVSDHYYMIPHTDMANRFDMRFYATRPY